jgi:hypothetical protein
MSALRYAAASDADRQGGQLGAVDAAPAENTQVIFIKRNDVVDRVIDLVAWANRSWPANARMKGGADDNATKAADAGFEAGHNKHPGAKPANRKPEGNHDMPADTGIATANNTSIDVRLLD